MHTVDYNEEDKTCTKGNLLTEATNLLYNTNNNTKLISKKSGQDNEKITAKLNTTYKFSTRFSDEEKKHRLLTRGVKIATATAMYDVHVFDGKEGVERPAR